MVLTVLGWTMVQKRVRWKHDRKSIPAVFVEQDGEVGLLCYSGSRYPTVCVNDCSGCDQWTPEAQELKYLEIWHSHLLNSYGRVSTHTKSMKLSSSSSWIACQQDLLSLPGMESLLQNDPSVSCTK